MTALVDTGFLYALLNETERQHAAVTAAFAQTPGPWLLPTPAVTEVAYLLMKFLGPTVLAAFLENLSTSSLRLVEPNEEDYRRAAQLVRQYQDAPLDLVDALLVAIAERLHITTILTLDQRHFHLVRPRHLAAFEILP
jgi:uncharacterized protein